MTDQQLKDAIERAVPDSPEWHRLVREACGRLRTFPLSWLPRVVSVDADASGGRWAF